MALEVSSVKKEMIPRIGLLVALLLPCHSVLAFGRWSSLDRYRLEGRIRQAVDYNTQVVRIFALRAIAAHHGGDYTIAQICDVWDAIYNGWVYVRDPPGLTFNFTPASYTIAY
jgi:hypothetical protein